MQQIEPKNLPARAKYHNGGNQDMVWRPTETWQRFSVFGITLGGIGLSSLDLGPRGEGRISLRSGDRVIW
jgi:hypothetical protein